MHKLVMLLLGVASLAFAGEAPSKSQYSQNVVEAVKFAPQGDWTITAIAGRSDVRSLSKVTQRRLIGAVLSIQGQRAELQGARFFSDKQSFPTTINGQQTYDTHSREFWLDFRTKASVLNLPRYVNATDLEFGTLLATGDGRAFFDLGGVWFALEFPARRNGRTL